MRRPLCYLSLGHEADADAIEALERESFPRPWTVRQLREVLRDGRVVVLRGKDTGVVAYCVFHRVAGELQIQTVAADPGLRRRGLARALLGWLLDAAARDGFEPAFLEVRAGNESARNLYSQLGFRRLTSRSFRAVESPDTALILSRSSSEPSPD